MAPVRTRLDRLIRWISVALVAAALAFGFPRAAALAPADLAVLAALVPLLLAVNRLHIPMLVLRNFGRKEGDPGSFLVDVPLFTFVFAAYGAYPTAIFHLIQSVTASGLRTQIPLSRRLFVGMPGAVFWFAMGYVRDPIAANVLDRSPQSVLWFFGLMMLAHTIYVFVWFDCMLALRTGRSLFALWRLHFADWTTWSLVSVQVLWGYLATQLLVRGAPVLAVLVLLPLPFMAMVLRRIHRDQLNIARLTQAHEVLASYLDSGDPIPTLERLLSSVQSEFLRQTLMIYITGKKLDLGFLPLARIGPPLEAETDERVRLLLRSLETERPAVPVTSGEDVIAYPVCDESNGSVLGALVVARTTVDRGVSLLRDDLRRLVDSLGPLLRAIGTVVAQKTVAFVDQLTQIPNRAAIEEFLAKSLEPSNDALHVAILDIDHFKSINDELGHLAGDQTLRLVAQTIAAQIRSQDRVGRLGGEEFLVVMPGADDETALDLAERIRIAVIDSGARHSSGAPLTISAGLARKRPGDSIESLLSRADEALYAAKRLGRNLSVAYDERLTFVPGPESRSGERRRLAQREVG